nr:hypothetical protein [Micromonospora sp. DSM 115978]
MDTLSGSEIRNLNENGDLDANEVATLSRYARALGARMRIVFDYGNELHQIA